MACGAKVRPLAESPGPSLINSEGCALGPRCRDSQRTRCCGAATPGRYRHQPYELEIPAFRPRGTSIFPRVRSSRDDEELRDPKRTQIPCQLANRPVWRASSAPTRSWIFLAATSSKPRRPHPTAEIRAFGASSASGCCSVPASAPSASSSSATTQCSSSHRCRRRPASRRSWPSTGARGAWRGLAACSWQSAPSCGCTDLMLRPWTSGTPAVASRMGASLRSSRSYGTLRAEQQDANQFKHGQVAVDRRSATHLRRRPPIPRWHRPGPGRSAPPTRRAECQWLRFPRARSQHGQAG